MDLPQHGGQFRDFHNIGTVYNSAINIHIVQTYNNNRAGSSGCIDRLGSDIMMMEGASLRESYHQLESVRILDIGLGFIKDF